jgi:hypothetical protein
VDLKAFRRAKSKELCTQLKFSFFFEERAFYVRPTGDAIAVKNRKIGDRPREK